MVDPKRVVSEFQSNFLFYDMSNFGDLDWMGALEEAAKGLVEVLPRKTLREQHYGSSQPLIVMPAYKGDFLEQLKKKNEKYLKEVKKASQKIAEGTSNIYDISMPSELLKHQESPETHEQTDHFTEFNNTDNMIDDNFYGTGGFYYDLYEIPEMTLDKAIRDRSEQNGPFTTPVSVKAVVASYLSGVLSVDMAVDRRPNVKVAKLLADLVGGNLDNPKGEYFSSKTKSYRPLLPTPVTPRKTRADRAKGEWRFVVPSASGGTPHTVVFRFDPKGNNRDLKKLDVRVSCTCPSFLYYGAQFNALRNHYLYGPIRPKYSLPRVRDPQNKFLVCKHILACVPAVSKFSLEGKIQKYDFKYKIKKELPPEKIKIPKDLEKYERDDRIQDQIATWEDWSPQEQRRFVQKRTDPEFLDYLANKFPLTSTHWVAERLNTLAEEAGSRETRREAIEILRELEAKKVPIPMEFRTPDRYKTYRPSPEMKQAESGWKTWSDSRRKNFVSTLKKPEDLGYVYFKFPEDEKALDEVGIKGFIMKTLSDMSNEDDTAKKVLNEIA